MVGETSSPNTAPGVLAAAAAAEQGSGSWWPQRREGSWVPVLASDGAQPPAVPDHPPVRGQRGEGRARVCVPLYLPGLPLPLSMHPPSPRESSVLLPPPSSSRPHLPPASLLSFICLRTELVPFPNSSMRTSECSVALFTALATCGA